jgi:hypothetical protein
MSKKAILIYSDKKTIQGLEDYSKKVNADVITKKDNYSKYDQILVLKNHITILPHAPDIFSITPKDKIGAVALGNFTPQQHKFSDHVFVVPSNLYNKNFSFEKHSDKMFTLSYKFNRIPELDTKTGEHRLSSFFVNYSGLLLNMPKNAVDNIIKKDLEDYKNDNYFKNYNVAVRVSGGYGDLVSAEPTVRYICEDLYKNDNVIIVTYAPELFDHIDRPKYRPDEAIPDASSYYVIDTFPNSGHISKLVVSPILVHACNYASICAIRTELPVEKRQIKLSLKWDSEALAVLKLGRQDFENMVLLHMGISWPSKTIPEDVWQTYIDKIIAMGKIPVLIGKDMDFRGVVKNVKTDNCIDLRNKIEVGELVALVSKIPILISNDSFPVHIAGAFDNYIGLIPTAKSADYILPYRNGDMYYKAKDLSKFDFSRTYESRPNFIDGSNVDQILDMDKFKSCLPSPSDIEDFIIECSENMSKEEIQNRIVKIEKAEF